MAILLIANILDLMFNLTIFEKERTNFIVYTYNLKKNNSTKSSYQSLERKYYQNYIRD